MKIEIGDLVTHNCADWVTEKIECNMESGIMSIRFISKDRLHLRILNELASQGSRITELEEKAKL